MTSETPTPSDSPYEEGDTVKIAVADDDLDAQYDGLECIVVEDMPDDLDQLTGDPLDRHHYQLERIETGERLPTWFRHHDLVPVSSDSE